MKGEEKKLMKEKKEERKNLPKFNDSVFDLNTQYLLYNPMKLLVWYLFGIYTAIVSLPENTIIALKDPEEEALKFEIIDDFLCKYSHVFVTTLGSAPCYLHQTKGHLTTEFHLGGSLRKFANYLMESLGFHHVHLKGVKKNGGLGSTVQSEMIMQSYYDIIPGCGEQKNQQKQQHELVMNELMKMNESEMNEHITVRDSSTMDINIGRGELFARRSPAAHESPTKKHKTNYEQ